MIKKGLGRGLGALIKEDNLIKIEGFEKDKIIEVNINKIEPNKNQPRKKFDKESLEQLANSIKSVGIISPIIVEKNGESYKIISGERRWRACRIVGLKKIPIIIKEYSNLEKIEISLIENIQREDLNAIEEAISYKKLQDDFKYSQEDIAKRIGKSRSAITNSIRLLKLDDRVKKLLIEDKISQGHCKALLSIEDKQVQFEISEEIIKNMLNVRQAEKLVKNFLESNKKIEENFEIKEQKIKGKEYEKIKNELNKILGTKVNIKSGKNKGKIEIEYYSEEDLDRILCILKNERSF